MVVRRPLIAIECSTISDFVLTNPIKGDWDPKSRDVRANGGAVMCLDGLAVGNGVASPRSCPLVAAKMALEAAAVQ